MMSCVYFISYVYLYCYLYSCPPLLIYLIASFVLYFLVRKSKSFSSVMQFLQMGIEISQTFSQKSTHSNDSFFRHDAELRKIGCNFNKGLKSSRCLKLSETKNVLLESLLFMNGQQCDRGARKMNILLYWWNFEDTIHATSLVKKI